jgi:hypothetical protein
MHIQVLFESLFWLIKLLSSAMVRNFVVMLGQTVNHCVYNSVILCNFEQCHIFVNYLTC